MGRCLNFLAVTAVALCLSTGLSHGIEVHNFDCKNCHKVGVSFTDLGNATTNVCRNCHKDNPPSILMLNDTTATPTAGFAPTDASNAMGSYPEGLSPTVAPGSQSSHMWATSDFNEAAGAQAPSDWRFYGRYGISTGKVTCQRCHDPHSRDVTNIKILRLGTGSKEAMCIDCHTPWNIDNADHALLSHPIVADYAAVQAANPDKYKAPDQIPLAQGEVSLVEGKVSCSTCHGIHFADSDGSTTDGPTQTLSSGDGHLLKADGPSSADKSALCQACHTYKGHGSTTETVGCQVCHSGHSYNGGTPNYYVLRNQAETTTYGLATNLAYRDLTSDLGGTSTTTALWSGTAGSDNGYCERCHGELTSMPGSSRAHIEGEDCNGCHNHNDESNEYAFGANCTDCHGWPPSVDAAGGTNGYAFVDGSRDYSADVNYKAETTTAHTEHAGAGSAYGMACDRCHDDYFAVTHNDNNFQNVFTGAMPDALSSAQGVLSPAYDKTLDGTCSNVYCHSNGGRRNSTGTKILGDYILKTISWSNQTISSCDACHGNDATDMATVNSASHIAHLEEGYSCNVCHYNTATSATALTAGAETGDHVNGAADVSFDNNYELSLGATLGLGSYGSNGTCAIYCHSDGQGSQATPDWDDAASGACGTCHGNAPSSGAHARHVSEAIGPQLACTACHPANSESAGHAEHVDGKIDVVAGVCNPCHGSAAGQSTAGHPDREPIWTSTSSVDCLTCHTGAEIAAVGGNGGAGTYVDKDTFAALGHGDSGLTGAPSCEGCHDASVSGHFDGNGADRLLTDPDANSSPVDPATQASAWCQQCHVKNVHFDDAHIGTGTSTSGNECAICHEPHGEGMGTNSDVMVIVGTGFVDKTVASSYFNDTNDGVCQVCHDANAVAHYNQAGSDGHNSGSVCSSCHTHGSDPAFQGGECYDCHGDGSAEYWPQNTGNDRTTDARSDFNNAGRHQRHMEVLAAELGHTLPGTEAQQKNICSYCHLVGDGDHAQFNNGQADVFPSGGKRLWDAAADSDATFSATDYSCANLACHNNKPTTSTYNWYTGGSGCLMCHSEDGGNVQAFLDPSSGLHIDQGVSGVTAHDGSFGVGGTCTSCHADPPTASHIDGTVNTDVSGFNFDPAIDLKLGTVSDSTDDTCLAACHSDSGNWYRLWSADAFDATVLSIDQPLPARCKVCHGVFGEWAEGTSHAGTSGGVASTIGSSHNSQTDANPGAACEDCHVFPSRDDLHEDGAITLNDSAEGDVDPTLTTIDTVDYLYCQACHNTNSLPPDPQSRVYPESAAFTFIEVDGANKPDGACFSGASGCHGDAGQNWWPNAEGADPTPTTSGGINYGYPNRAGAHPEHNFTIGQLIAETRSGDPNATPTQDDYNNTCQFCHPMTENVSGTLTATYHNDGKTDLYGGVRYTSADRAGSNVTGDPSSSTGWSQYDDGTDGDGYIYQRDNPENPGSLYPLDGDGSYRQYLYSERGISSVNHGTCSNIACHSNAPFTPQWYGDDQAPGEITDLVAATHDTRETHVNGATDQPGTVLLTWTAPGDNGQLNGTAYEYEVYYSTAGEITEANLGSATRAGGAPPVQREGTSQEMVVDGLDPHTNYWFAVRTQDEPFYEDNNGDGIRETFVRDGNTSPLAATASAVAAHTDDVAPIYWGINSAKSHDTGDAVNLSWDAARDHTLPITYRVYWSGYSLKTHLARGGTLPVPGATAYSGGVESTSYMEDAGGGAPTEGGSDYTIYVSTTRALTYQASGLSSGVLYNFLVRAEDGATTPNVDDNTAVAMALASSLPQEEERTELYLLNGASGMTVQTDPTNPDWTSVSASSIALSGTDSVTFTADTDLDGAISRETWLQGISMDIHVTNEDRRLPQSFQVQFGHDNGSGSFTAIGSAVDVGLGRRASRVMKVSLSANKGLIPADANLMIQFTRTTTSGSTSDITLAWGNDADKGQLLINAQPVNHAPSAPVVHALSRDPGGYVQITWDTSSDNDNGNGGQTLHYDIFASCDGGSSWPYVLGYELTDADAVAGVRWDTVGDGLDRFSGGQYECQVKVEASDGYLFETTPGSNSWLSHTASSPASISLDNRYDDEAPAAVNIHHVETRPKQGTTYLEWIAVGNDGYNHGTRAAYYDIRYRKTADGTLADANWDDAATYQAEGEPVPDFSGYGESFELVGMTPDTEHTLGMKTCDAGEDDVPYTSDDNCSPLSNVVTHMSGQYYCGICHSTPPDEPDTRGTHRAHGFTEEDCAKCHGDAVLTYDGRHYDGVINIGWAENSDGTRAPLVGLLNASGGSGVTITQTTDSGDVIIYEDQDGAGGYNAGTAYDPAAPLQNTDSGTCLNFGTANARGCHGPFQPKWEDDTTGSRVEPSCADCHGSKDMTEYDDISNETGRLTDPYGRQWDEVDTTKTQINGFYQPTDQVEASPPIDNHNLGGKDTRYTGAHLRHLNASFRFAKGDSCRLCHKGIMESGLHANREVNVVFDVSADQSESVAAQVDDTLVDVDTKGVSCSNMNNAFCHDAGARWAEPGAKCNDCHGMAGKAFDPLNDNTEIGHVMGANGDVVPCEYCHVAGHPQSPDGITSGDPDALLINNNAAIGISYRSGGIHLKRAYPWGTYNSLAEICWGCHDQNHDGDLNDPGDINEFGTNQRAATGNSAYHYGILNQSTWVGAVWSSGYGQTSSDPFYYKRGSIQSTHSTDPSGTSQVTWNSARGRYDETPDPVDRIRCSNCHDVHNLNQAPGDTMTGIPYLRGTWMGNPYEEDGAPWNARAYSEPQDGSIDYGFGAVPRGGTEYDQLGGFYIDQNNALPGTGNNANPTPSRYPTSGWTLKSSAGLCTLCHGTHVDTMDQRTPAMDPVEGNLWLGTNGHSNSALGGSFSNGANIFDFSHGRPTPVTDSLDGKGKPADTSHMSVIVPDMAFLSQGEDATAGAGYRGYETNTGFYQPPVTGTTTTGQGDMPYAYNGYDWGASVDATTIDQMYHQFSCSKCHNPHASRLPKLMITNCLDIRHNTWDDNQSTPYLQNDYTASALTDVDRGMPAAFYAAAQNCHRYDGRRSTSDLRGGWNKVTPWAYTDYGTGTEEEHKGAHDPAYSSRSGN